MSLTLLRLRSPYPLVGGRKEIDALFFGTYVSLSNLLPTFTFPSAAHNVKHYLTLTFELLIKVLLCQLSSFARELCFDTCHLMSPLHFFNLI